MKLQIFFLIIVSHKSDYLQNTRSTIFLLRVITAPKSAKAVTNLVIKEGENMNFPKPTAPQIVIFLIALAAFVKAFFF